MAQQITLGCKAKDRVSGFTGIVTSRHEDVSGTLQWGIQPLATKKSPDVHPDAISFDHNQVQYVAVGEMAKVVPAAAAMHFKLGDKIRDRVTGYEGIATVRSDWMNGCTLISIQGKGKEGEIPPKRQNCALRLAERVDDGINDKPVAVAKERTGGAPQRVERDSF